MAQIICPSCGVANEVTPGVQATCKECSRPLPFVSATPADAPAPTVAAASPHHAPAWIAQASQMEPFGPRAVDWFLKMISGIFTEGLFRMAVAIGLIGGELLLYLSVIFFGIVAIIGGAQAKSFSAVAMPLLALILVLTLCYVALKLIAVARSMIPASPSRIGGALLTCISGLAIGLAVYFFFKPFTTVNLGYAVWLEAFAMYWLGILGCLGVVVIANRPSLVNVSVESSLSAGQEFLGLIAFLTKALVSIAPIILAIFAAVANVAVLLAAIALFNKDDTDGFLRDMRIEMALDKLHAAVAIPIVIVLMFLLYQLIVSLCNAVLRINDIADSKKSGM